MFSTSRTILLITKQVLARIDLRGRRRLSVQQIWTEPSGDYDAILPQVSRALKLASRRPGRVTIVSPDFWTDILSIPSDVTAIASENEIKQAVKNNIRDAIQKWQEDIKENEQTIAEFGEHKLNLPDSYAYKRSDSLVAYLWRDKRVYRFATRKSEGESFEAMAAKFSETLARFRTRALYEIPAEPGVCIPYGFFADNGSIWYQLTNSLRLKDAPNVMYTVGIGKNGDNPKATGLNVWAASIMQGAGSYVERQITQRIKPREIKIGAMQGIMGGFTIKPDRTKGNDQEQSYHLQAGYDGEPNSDLFPFVAFQMRSYTKGADPSLTRIAPPLAPSQARLIGLMKSVRLRAVSESK